MSALALSQGIAPERPQLLARMIADEPILTRLGLLMALSLVVTLVASQIDGRLFQGENVWIKPVKFQISLTVYLLTLGVFARWLPEGLTATLGWRVYSGIVALAIVLEMLWIGGAAAAGTGSHFNVASPAMSAIYSLMGVLAVILTSASLVFAFFIWRNAATGLPSALHLSIVLGLALTFLLTVPVAGTMAGSLSHFVGTPTTGATLWPIGWSREVGDLRVAHFFAAHAMHFIPVGGLLAVWLLPDTGARVAVLAGSAAFIAFVGFTFWQALNGLPLIP